MSEALRLAAILEDEKMHSMAIDTEAAAELRRLHALNDELVEALREAEAGLADIGDADREPGDDLAWCEQRAAEALPPVRAALAKVGESNG